MNKFIFLLVGISVVGTFFFGGYIAATRSNQKLRADISSIAALKTVSSSSSTSDSTLDTNECNTPAPIPPKLTTYKLLRFADECTIDKFAAKGWTIAQAGGVPEVLTGGPYYASDCRSISAEAIDWVMLEKEQ